MQRREFLRRTAVLGATAIAGAHLAPQLLAAAPAPAQPATPTTPAGATPDLALVEGADPFAATLRAVELAGGISRFVKPGAKVGLLINAPSWWRKPGSFTSPDLTLAVLQLCLDAGAREITYVIDPASDYWSRTPLGAKYPKLTAAGRRNPGVWSEPEVTIPRGLALKQAKVNRTALECEVLINLPIAKHHAGTGFTGALKNFMGACHRSTNQFFHSGSAKGAEDIAFLSQCIADVNLVRRPDLAVCDGTEFLLTNGPAGPGEVKRANKVIVGADPVAVDALGCTLLGLSAEKVAMIGMAAAHGIGQSDLAQLTVREAKL